MGLALVTLAIFAISLVVIVKWPAIRGRGFIIGSCGLSAVAHCGFFGLGIIQWLMTTFGGSNAHEFFRLIQIGYLLLNLATPISGVLLLLGVVALGRELTAILQQITYLEHSRMPPPAR